MFVCELAQRAGEGPAEGDADEQEEEEQEDEEANNENKRDDDGTEKLRKRSRISIRNKRGMAGT